MRDRGFTFISDSQWRQVQGERTHRTPATMFVVRYWPLDSPSQLLEPIEHGQLKEHIDSEDDILRFFRKPLSGEEAMIEDVSEHQHGEIQSWKLRHEGGRRGFDR